MADALAVQLGRRHSSIVIAFHQAVADQLGVNATDLKALDLATTHGSTTAGQVAEATGLTTGAVTFLIDRLENAGFLTRTRDPTDRRRWALTVTPDCAERVADLYQPLATDMQALAGRFSAEELQTISRYVAASDDILERHTSELRGRTNQLAAGRRRP
ncbi:MAG: MarR family transcriptional regulator [Terracoccus sp.]